MECPFGGLDQHDEMRDRDLEGAPKPGIKIIPPARKKALEPAKKEAVQKLVDDYLEEAVRLPTPDGVPDPVGPGPIPVPPPIPPGRREGEPARIPVAPAPAAAAIRQVAKLVPRHAPLPPWQEAALRGFSPRQPVPRNVRLPRLQPAARGLAISEKVVTQTLVTPPPKRGISGEIDEGHPRTVPQEVRSRSPGGFGFGLKPSAVGFAAAGGAGGFMLNAALRLRRMMGQPVF